MNKIPYLPRTVGAIIDFGYYKRIRTEGGTKYQCLTCGLMYYSLKGIKYHFARAHLGMSRPEGMKWHGKDYQKGLPKHLRGL